MKLVLGADHGGFDLKENIKEYLTKKESNLLTTVHSQANGVTIRKWLKKLPQLLQTAPSIKASSSVVLVSVSALQLIKYTAFAPLFARTNTWPNTAVATTTRIFSPWAAVLQGRALLVKSSVFS